MDNASQDLAVRCACRDKIRTQLAEAIQLAIADAPDGNPGARAAEVEEAVLKQNGAPNAKYKAKIRSIWVNLKDPKNPDFRRLVLQRLLTGRIFNFPEFLGIYCMQP